MTAAGNPMNVHGLNLGNTGISKSVSGYENYLLPNGRIGVEFSRITG
jgi:hypothetical protein